MFFEVSLRWIHVIIMLYRLHRLYNIIMLYKVHETIQNNGPMHFEDISELIPVL